MREDMGLFRGKRLDNGEWVEGSLFVGDNGECEICYGTPRVRITYAVDSATVSENTALNDKNGKRIFEGDIVIGEDALAKGMKIWGYIDYMDGSFIIVNDIMKHYRWLDYVVEVIGNIHDNHEMLEV